MRRMDEILIAIHTRAQTLRRRQMMSAGAASIVLSVALITLIASNGGLHHRTLSANYTGASLLSDNAGGYVLAAVIAFMAGVVITVICVRHKNGGGWK